MGVVHYIGDKLKNFVANLGTDRDKASGSYYVFPCIDETQLENAYRGAWLPRKIVDIPAMDACRRWRAWQTDKDEVGKIEAEEKRLGLQAKILEAKIKARLWGGAAVYLATGDLNPALPLLVPKALKHLTVITRRQLMAGEVETDQDSPQFGQPKFYTIANTQQEIHPSRLVLFKGAALPDEQPLTRGVEQGWGDSVLLAIMEAIKNADSTMGNVASLIFEAKVDVLKIPDFMQNVADSEYRNRVLERLTLAATAKGINGMLLLDSLEDYEQKHAQFASLPDLIDRFLQVVSGAADIPATRLLGQAPAGMNSTGESDTRNYYDRIQSVQELEMTPAMRLCDDCVLIGALGSRPEEIHYVWNSLWQPTAMERSTIGKTTADTIKVLADTRLFPEEALQQIAENMLIEYSITPGIEQALDDFGREIPQEPEVVVDPNAIPIGDAAPRTLYVSRKVLNGAEILAWAKGQGFESTQPAAELHVTIAFSREKLDWMKVGQSWTGERDGKLMIPAGGARIVEHLGDKGAVVLLFNSSELSWRHEDIKRAGASWDFPEYQPHVTITYKADNVDVARVEPYRGAIEFGPEIFEEVVEDWEKTVSEVRTGADAMPKRTKRKSKKAALEEQLLQNLVSKTTK